MSDAAQKASRGPGPRPIYGDGAMVVASLRLTESELAVFQAMGAQWFRNEIDSAQEPGERRAHPRKAHSMKTTEEQREKLKRLGSDWVSDVLAAAATTLGMNFPE